MHRNYFSKRVIIEKFQSSHVVEEFGDGSRVVRFFDSFGRIGRMCSEPAEIYEDGKCLFYSNGEAVYASNLSSAEEQIEEIIQEFDFEEVRRVMLALDWIWAECNGTPDVAWMKRECRRYLWDAYEYCHNECEDIACISFGGFEASYVMGKGFSLKFVLTKWTTCP